MISRERILEAAVRVYAKHGFRGATTRAIATEAGVNEVTLFRTFGSKAALMQAVLDAHLPRTNAPLPSDPQDPERELGDWVTLSLDRARELRPLIIHTMGEIEERPESAEFARCGRENTQGALTEYATRLQAKGLAEPEADVVAATTMLVHSVMGDVMSRPICGDLLPPIAEAGRRYVRGFLRMIGCPVAAATAGAAADESAPPAPSKQQSSHSSAA